MEKPDEQETAYLNIKLWLERSLTSEAREADNGAMWIAKALHHLPIIKPNTRAPQWQDISTAPRDGQLILATRDRHIGMVKFRDGEWENVDHAGYCTGTGFYPLFWWPLMTLPAPPEVG